MVQIDEPDCLSAHIFRYPLRLLIRYQDHQRVLLLSVDLREFYHMDCSEDRL